MADEIAAQYSSVVFNAIIMNYILQIPVVKNNIKRGVVDKERIGLQTRKYIYLRDNKMLDAKEISEILEEYDEMKKWMKK